MSHQLHKAVMPQEALTMLNLSPGGCVIDATLGMAGHAFLIGERLGERGHLIGIDRDGSSLILAKQRLVSLSLRVDLLQGSFGQMRALCAEIGVTAVDGILMDLGISSFQLDDPLRGLSFMHDGPLDMRMDQQQEMTAASIINQASEEELARIFFEYAQERFARRFAKAIVAQRTIQPFRTTAQLAVFILKQLPLSYQRGRIHPATRVFQALRMAVNSELNVLEQALPQAFELLKPKGRLVVISFHSLEDRIVKHFFKHMGLQRATVITKKPMEPTAEEIEHNPRARSAKMRVLEKS